MVPNSHSPHSLLTSGLNEMHVAISDQAVDQLVVYFEELKKWGKKINLVSSASDQQILETHFIDSLTLLPLIQQMPEPSLLDVGSGAGFPGLVLKVAAPHLSVTLIEPRQKRVSFLKHICRTINISGVKIVCQRLGDNDQNPISLNDQYSVITCRALTTVSKFLQMVNPLSARRGYVICMKGPLSEEEILAWQNEKSKSYILIKSHQLTLPFSKASRVLVVFQKK